MPADVSTLSRRSPVMISRKRSHACPTIVVRGLRCLAAGPTRDTGGRLTPARRGFSPRKRRRLLLGTTTYPSGRTFDVADRAGWLRDRYPILTKSINVKNDGLSDLCPDFLNRGTGCDTSWKIRNISRIISFGFLDYYGILHRKPQRFSPACLSILACVPGAKSSLGFPGTVTRPYLRRVLILPMAAPLGRDNPTIVGKQSENIANLHWYSQIKGL